MLLLRCFVFCRGIFPIGFCCGGLWEGWEEGWRGWVQIGKVGMYWFSPYRHHRKNPDDVTVGPSSQFYNGERKRIRFSCRRKIFFSGDGSYRELKQKANDYNSKKNFNEDTSWCDQEMTWWGWGTTSRAQDRWPFRARTDLAWPDDDLIRLTDDRLRRRLIVTKANIISKDKNLQKYVKATPYLTLSVEVSHTF